MPASPSTASRKTVFESPQQKKEILREVVRTVQTLEENVNLMTLEHVDKILVTADEINDDGTLDDKINDQSEVFLDSQVMTISSRVMKKCSYALSTNFNVFDPLGLAEKIKAYLNRIPNEINPEGLDYSLIGGELMKMFKRTGNFSMLMGTLKEIPHKEIVRKPRAPKEAQAQIKRPESVKVAEKVEETVEDTVAKIYNLIKAYLKSHEEPLDFFKLVLHPTDFGRTVENMLHTSFLVRDGKIKVSLSDDGLPVISKGKDGKSDESKKKHNTQNVLALTMKQWKELVEAYNIKRPMIEFQLGTTTNGHAEKSSRKKRPAVHDSDSE